MRAGLLAGGPVKAGVCLVSPLVMQLWQAALSTLNPSPTDSCPLYLNYATVAALPSRVSRHNSPSAAHFVTRLVRTCLPPGTHRCILVSGSEGLAPHGPLSFGSLRAGCWPGPVAQPSGPQSTPAHSIPEADDAAAATAQCNPGVTAAGDTEGPETERSTADKFGWQI